MNRLMKKLLLSAIITIFSLARGCAQTVYSENFEGASIPGLPTGYTEVHAGGGLGWETHKGPIRWGANTVGSHTKYALVNDYQYFWNNTAMLTTGTFSLIGATNPRLSFECMFVEYAAIEKAWVEISTNGGATFTTLDTLHTSGIWVTKFMDMSGVMPSASCKLRFCYSSVTGAGLYGGGLYGLAIDDIKVYSPMSTDLALTAVTPEDGIVESYVRTGDSVIFSGYINNPGTSSIPSFTVYYQVGIAAPVSQYFSTVCAPFSWNAFTAFSIPYVPSATGPQTVKIWVSATGDGNPLNDTIRTTITGVAAPHLPVKRMFTEELTGAWCGWCPRGIVYMDSLWKVDSANASIVCVHSKITQDGMAGDNITTKSYDTMTNRGSGLGYPSVILDRHKRTAVEYSPDEMKLCKKMFGFAEIGVTQNVTGGTLTARATIKPSMDLSGDYRLELIVEEEQVTGTTWLFQQANAYSGNPTIMEGCGYRFNDSANIIPPGHIKFRFVARWTIPENLYNQPNGIAGSLPATMHTDSFYSYTFAPVTIPANWNAAKLRCIAVLIDNNPQSPNYGFVLNSATTSHPALVGPTTGIAETPETGMHMELYPNPTNEEVSVSFRTAESTVTDVCIYDMLGRMVTNVPAGQSTEAQVIKIPTKNIPAGMYSVTLRSGTNRATKLLTVTK